MRCIEYDYSHKLVGSTSFFKYSLVVNSFDDGGPYHIKNSPLICYSNQWAGFYMMGTFFIKELNGISSNAAGKILINLM